MKTDKCGRCGGELNKPEAHTPGCANGVQPSDVVGRTFFANVLFQDQPAWPTNCKLLFHADGTITWEKLWNQ